MPNKGHGRMVWLEASGVWARMPANDNKRAVEGIKQESSDLLKREQNPTTLSKPFLDKDDHAGDGEKICSICLDEVSLKHKAVLYPCMHEAFHHRCICQWLSVKQECPLCKIRATSIFYSFKDDGGYEERELPHAPPSMSEPRRAEIMSRLAEILGVADLLRGELSALRAAGHPRHGSGSRPVDRSNRISSQTSVPSQYSLRVQRHSQSTTRRTRPEPEDRGQHGTVQNPIGATTLEEEDALRWRRRIYDRELWAIPLGSHTHASRSLAAPSGRLRRVSEWVDRELEALLGTQDNTIVRGFIMGLVATYGANPPDRPSRHFAEPGRGGAGEESQPVGLLRPFLGVRAAHFWHELACFVTAPAYTVATYDRIVEYAQPRWLEEHLEECETGLHGCNAVSRRGRGRSRASSRSRIRARRQSRHSPARSRSRERMFEWRERQGHQRVRVDQGSSPGRFRSGSRPLQGGEDRGAEVLASWEEERWQMWNCEDQEEAGGR